MKRNHKKATRRTQVVKVWTRTEAQQALPLIRSVMQSLREHRLEAQAQHLRAERFKKRPGRPDRNGLIAHAEAVQAATEANDRFDAGLRELLRLNVYCLDPIQGQALIPFAHGANLAWFVFDLFEPDALKTWRYHEDPITMRRPIAELEQTAKPDSLII
jgi:hypothetical protein